MGYKVEWECDQTFVDPTTGEFGVHAGEHRPEGHPDIGPSWKPVLVKVEEEPSAPAPAPAPAPTPAPAPAPTPAPTQSKTAK